MLYNIKNVEWIRQGGEVDLPHNGKKSLQYLTIGFISDKDDVNYGYYKYFNHITGEIHNTYTDLEHLVNITNSRHDCDDVVTSAVSELDRKHKATEDWINSKDEILKYNLDY